MKKLLIIPVIAIVLCALLVGCGTAAPTTTSTTELAKSDTYEQTAVWTGPNVPEPIDWHYDIPLYDGASNRFYLADASNARVDVWNTTDGSYVGNVPGFTGAKATGGGFGAFGPNGLAFDNQNRLWAGDGNGDIWLINPTDLSVIQKVATGAKLKADVFSYDAADDIMLVTCGDDEPGFIEFIDVKTLAILGKIEFGDLGLGDPEFNSTTGKFYLPVITVANGVATGGEIEVISPLTRTVESKIDLGKDIYPTSIAFGPGNELGVGCFPNQKPVIIDYTSGKVLLALDASTSERGIGSVLYDAGWDRFFFAEPTGIRVVDATALTSLPTILGHADPGGAGSRPLTLDPVTHQLYGAHDKEGVVIFSPTTAAAATTTTK
jgi:hypothetical protein